jgi:predicted MFS family arabinose efflux permease
MNSFFFQVLASTHYRWPLLTTVILQFAQALSGVNAVFFYSSKMFAKAGVPLEYIPYANIGTGLINVIATIASLFLIDKLGRRLLIIYPMIVMVFVFAALTILVQLNETRNSAALGILTVIFILIFIVCFDVGLGPIPYMYGIEVCRPEARDSVQSLGLIANYLGNSLVSLFFPALNLVLGGCVFLIFLVLVLVSLIILYFKMPETRNKTHEDIEKFWKISAALPEDTPLRGEGVPSP